MGLCKLLTYIKNWVIIWDNLFLKLLVIKKNISNYTSNYTFPIMLLFTATFSVLNPVVVMAEDQISTNEKHIGEQLKFNINNSFATTELNKHEGNINGTLKPNQSSNNNVLSNPIISSQSNIESKELNKKVESNYNKTLNTDAFQKRVASYITGKYKNTSYQDALVIARSVQEESKKHNIDPTLILGLIENESSFKKNAISKYNAKGLMQVVPKWHLDTINKVVRQNGGNLVTIENNIAIGTKILKSQLNKYGTIQRALQAYNGDHYGTTYSTKVMKFQNKIKNHLKSL